MSAPEDEAAICDACVTVASAWLVSHLSGEPIDRAALVEPVNELCRLLFPYAERWTGYSTRFRVGRAAYASLSDIAEAVPDADRFLRCREAALKVATYMRHHDGALPDYVRVWNGKFAFGVACALIESRLLVKGHDKNASPEERRRQRAQIREQIKGIEDVWC